MAEPDVTKPIEVNPYTLPPELQGWRGATLPGAFKRKWYTLLHNEQVLVTALLLIPGESSVRHSHESGELSIHYEGEMKPYVVWNPPGALHPGIPTKEPTSPDALAELADSMVRELNPQLARVLETMHRQHERMKEQIAKLTSPAPFIIVDVLFPPFKTTIDDPRVREKKVVVGQWYD